MAAPAQLYRIDVHHHFFPALLKYVPVAPILFDSDYPFVSVTENVSDIGKLGSAVDDQKAIERDNALRLITRLRA